MAQATITIPVTFTVEMADEVAQYADSVDAIDAVDAQLHVILARYLLGDQVSTYVTVDGQDDVDLEMTVLRIETPYPDECGGVQY